jgi:hypothetical protein
MLNIEGAATIPTLPVRYLSQWNDITDPAWKERSCSIVCLAMVLGFYFPERPVISANDLLEEGLAIKGHTYATGWKQDALVALSHNHGLPLYREEFRSLLIDRNAGTGTPSADSDTLRKVGTEKIISWLSGGDPVIISTLKRFSVEGTYHTVLLIGVAHEGGIATGFYYHDPDSDQEGGGERRFVSMETFQQYWRRFALFPYSPNFAAKH